jgi:hypothetical protein
MTTPNPDHLLEQADRLATPNQAGAPRQVDLRRAISAAYYAVFHELMIAVADEFVGKTQRDNSRYALPYRSVDHRTLREVCENVSKSTPPAKYAPFMPASGVSNEILAIAAAVKDLQERRHSADYDPMFRASTNDVAASIQTARTAMGRFRHATNPQRKLFLTLLAFPPR